MKIKVLSAFVAPHLSDGENEFGLEKQAAAWTRGVNGQISTI